MRPSFPPRARAAVAAAVLSSAVAPTAAVAATFGAEVTAYTQGTVNIAGSPYNTTSAATGAPASIVGAGQYAGVHSPFNAAYQAGDLVAIGRGGSITVRYGQPVAVVAGANTPEVGVFTGVGILDADYPNGFTGASPMTFAAAEYGAERSAVVEVAGANGTFVSLGRVTFSTPTNAFNDAADPFQATPGAAPADFGKPYTGGLAGIADKNYAGILSALAGSGGGTWINVPDNAGLASVSFVRFSDPLWVLTSNGATAESRASIYDPTFVKPADLFIDSVSGVAATPEPGAAAAVACAAGAALLRRRARHPRSRRRAVGR